MRKQWPTGFPLEHARRRVDLLGLSDRTDTDELAGLIATVLATRKQVEDLRDELAAAERTADETIVQLVKRVGRTSTAQLVSLPESMIRGAIARTAKPSVRRPRRMPPPIRPSKSK